MNIIEIRGQNDIASMIPVVQLYGAIYKGERNAHKFVITVTRNGEAVALTGSVTGKVLRADNVAVALIGSIEDGKATVTLTDECYAVPGRFKLSIFVTDAGETETVCVYAAVGTTDRTESSTIIDGGEIIPSITDLIAEIEAAVATIPPDYSTLTNGVVRHDIAQSLTDAQKAQARANIGAVIDSTLTVSGAVADAKATGDEISDVKSAFAAIGLVIYNGQFYVNPDGNTLSA